MKIAKDILLKNKDTYIKNNQKLIIQILQEYHFYLSKKNLQDLQENIQLSGY